MSESTASSYTSIDWHQRPGAQSTAPPGQTAAIWERQISAVIDAWLSETSTMSSIEDIRRNANYQLLRRIGWPVAAVLLRWVQNGVARLQCAELLTEITGEDPVDPVDYGNARRIGTAWLKWGLSKGFL